MSWRIEQADALTLLRELPDNWVQTCIARPPRTGAPDRTLAILAEVRRVLRDDGTLWLSLGPGELCLDDLQDEGWLAQSTPRWARRLTACGRPATGLFLLAAERRYFYDAHTIDPHSRPSSCLGASRQTRRTQNRVPVRDRERSLRLLRRCVMAGSSPLACGECGTPYRRTRPKVNALGGRHPTCPHHNPDGRCLVLDPFYHPMFPTAEAALCAGRNFLGIEDTASAGESR